MDSLRAHRDYLDREWRAALAAPLSRRKAMLVAALIDAYVDRLFGSAPGVDDILEFRAGMASTSPALGRIMSLCAQRDGIALELVAVAVPIEDYGGLPVEDFMVSLYNDHSVQRLRLALPGGEQHDMLETLREAIGALD